jgi:hypothetical protein
VTSPYREDELENLRAENERLRKALAARRGAHGGLALLLVGVEGVALLLFRPWLNGASDLRFWAALLVLGGIAAAAVVSGYGFRRIRL